MFKNIAAQLVNLCISQKSSNFAASFDMVILQFDFIF